MKEKVTDYADTINSMKKEKDKSKLSSNLRIGIMSKAMEKMTEMVKARDKQLALVPASPAPAAPVKPVEAAPPKVAEVPKTAEVPKAAPV